MSHEFPDNPENLEELPLQEEPARIPGELNDRERQELRLLLEDIT